MDRDEFSQILLLAHSYLANPTQEKEKALYLSIRIYFLRAQSDPSLASLRLLFRLRHFLFICDQNRQSKTNFKFYAAREFLIRVARPSVTNTSFLFRRYPTGCTRRAVIKQYPREHVEC